MHTSRSNRPLLGAALSPENVEFRGADLSFLRPKDHLPVCKPTTMNNLPLCPHNLDFFALVRPPTHLAQSPALDIY
jgi:hypothetical protein